MSNDSKSCNWDDAERNICKGQMHDLTWLMLRLWQKYKESEITTSYQNGSRIVSNIFTSFTCIMCSDVMTSIKNK